MLKPLVPKFRLDLSARLEGIAEKQVSAKLKPIVGRYSMRCTEWLASLPLCLAVSRELRAVQVRRMLCCVVYNIVIACMK